MEIYAPSKNENVSPRQNIFELIVDMRLSNLEPLKGESESLKQMFVGFQITKETLGYLDRNYGKNCTKNYHQDLDSSIIKRKRNGNEEIEEEEDTDDDANGSMNFIEKWRQMGLNGKLIYKI
ncbi:2878_t:CDS:2 [Rhizophagus irregularis]|nr:2878_t:CDS:2 [Rhizophagus irregularis]